ncbi:MAG: hypothetical protein M1826_006031 [Phylliscum demangeonii]|nr:MAG: hypothetical protein M1826_006031 [Phylliscum demangeonii]
MATFAKASYSASSYAAFRPSYPPALYRTVLDYHQGPRDLCLDLGCGPGAVGRALAPAFRQVIGIDPSAGMVAEARSLTATSAHTSTPTNLSYRQGAAEDLAFAANGSVDLVVAGQAVHWFDLERLFAELQRVVRPNGTLAFWGYKDHVFVDYPRATEILNGYAAVATGRDLLADYWAQPGRSILQDQLRAVRPPERDWHDVRRLEYEPGVEGPRSGRGELLMKRRLTLGECKEYLKTWSAYHAWREAHPAVQSADEGGSGDVIDRLFDDMVEAERDWKTFRPHWTEMEVEIEWGTALIMARKK